MAKCRCSVFKKAPHFLKPIQVLLSIAILITVIIIMWGPLERLWYHAVFALIISGFATLLFALGVQRAFVERYSCGFLSWNAVEFAYSLFLTWECGDSFWWAYWCAKHNESHAALFILVMILFAFLTLSYAAAVLYIFVVEVKVLLAKSEYAVVKPDDRGSFLEI